MNIRRYEKMGNERIDPRDFDFVENFKRAFYNEHGTGSWMDDLKLSIIYRKTHNIELDDYMKKLITN